MEAPEPLSAEYFCSSCRTAFQNSFPLDAEGRCALCRSGLRGFDAAYSFGAYEGVLRELIHLYKYGRIKTLARPLSGLADAGAAARRGLRYRGAGAALLAPPVAARVQSVGTAGARTGPPHRYSGGECVAAFAADARPRRVSAISSRRQNMVRAFRSRNVGGKTHSADGRRDDYGGHRGLLRARSQTGGREPGCAFDRGTSGPAHGRLAPDGGSFDGGGKSLNAE